MKFIVELGQGEEDMAELCRRFGISRPTGYKWQARYQQQGPAGLLDLGRAPKQHPNAISSEVEEKILQLRMRHPRWGPRKLRAWWQQREPQPSWPVASTIGALLKRRGLAVPRRKRRRTPPYTAPFVAAQDCNLVWCADLKGWFRTGDGQRCDPLTISDAFSRYLLRCQVVPRPDSLHVQAVFEAAFREYGLPQAIRTDNGAPFASRAVGGLSPLSLWWVKLGIVPERIAPGQPQQNGRHERMHRTLKAEAATPPAAGARGQQRSFDRFRQIYNEERPHEALGQCTPASLYRPSPRPFPNRLPPVEYPAAFQVRRVQRHGEVYWKHRALFISEVLAGETVGFQPVQEHCYRLFFQRMPLGIFDLRRWKIRPLAGHR